MPNGHGGRFPARARKDDMTMTKVLGLALVLALLSGLAHADPPPRAGRLNYVHGTVSLATAQAPESWAVAVVNRPLTAGDRLWTDRDGYAELHVGSTAVRLAPRTNLDVLTLDDDTLQLRLAQGDVNVRVRDVGDDTIEIDTPNGAVLLEEPGSYRISAAPEGDMTHVIVHSGRAHVLAEHGALSVRAGQHVTLRGMEGVPSEISRAGMDAFDRWSAELDRREDATLSTRYVSPHMTGYEDLDAYGTWRTMPEYGAVWVPSVPTGWAPYRYGHWVWIEPWGWTWVDDAPWGFAPFHYGRWVWLNGYWAWAPGPRIARPVYAPALVAFVGGTNWSVAVRSGPAVGWFPLGWREPFFPWYRASPHYVRNVNATHVRNINIYSNVTRVTYVHHSVPHAVTVVSRQAFVSARPVARSVVDIPPAQVTRAPLMKSMPAQPIASSFAARRADSRPPETAVRREVIAARAPRAHAGHSSGLDADPKGGRTEGERTPPRVRVIERQRADADSSARRRAEMPGTAAHGAPGTQSVPQANARKESRAQQEKERRPRAFDDDRRPNASTAPRNERREEPSRETRSRDVPDRMPDAKPAPAVPRVQRQPDADRQRRPSAEAPTAPPHVQPERRSRLENEPRGRRETEPHARREPQGRSAARDHSDSPRERRPSPGESRSQQREPRSQAQPAPRAFARDDARSQRPTLHPAPSSSPTRAGPPRAETRGQERTPAPRSNARENRNRRD